MELSASFKKTCAFQKVPALHFACRSFDTLAVGDVAYAESPGLYYKLIATCWRAYAYSSTVSDANLVSCSGNSAGTFLQKGLNLMTARMRSPVPEISNIDEMYNDRLP